MAKKKAVSSDTSATESKTAPASTGKSPASADGRQGVFTDELIGNVAGEVWQVLSSNGGQSLTALKKSVDGPGDLVLAAVGWLAREGKLEFTTSGRTMKVSLR